MHYAEYDPNKNPAEVIGWYDTDEFEYKNLPNEDALLEVPDDIWEDRLNTKYHIADKKFVEKPKDLPFEKHLKNGQLGLSCAAAITAGFTYDALGEEHFYPYNINDQLNMSTAAVAASNTKDENWQVSIWCKLKDTWLYEKHNAEQIINVVSAGRDFVTKNQQKLQSLRQDLQNANSEDEINQINWSE